MYTSTTKNITLAIMLGAIASLVVAGASIASVRADINTTKGVTFEKTNTKNIIVNLPAGKNGKDGKDGKDGTDGVNGRDGINGVNGTNGQDGAPGRDGINGTNGRDGINGINGTNGIDGLNGKDGINGTNGVNGRDGVNGTNGRDGVDGRDATATILLNFTSGQIVCTVGAPDTIGCVEVNSTTPNDNGTVVVPPSDNGTVVIPPSDNGTVIVIPPVDNGTTGNDSGSTGGGVDNSTVPVENGG